ncbi:uncharacterized protein LOC120144227 [Hibiscus syriacus]|uniref:uncharacterized protein LOC120144227 n=1 Tax=Hibiscus syriacus TaxID=106335 RepID=UPI00192213D0|nr:uncharacterized protein LOC120144227 [Hibiscus syriacus]
MIHSLKHEDGGRGGIILKLDFSKAYDCVRWEFLIMVLERILNLKRILRCFEVCSGLSINFSKSCLVGINVDEELINRLAIVCGCKIGSLPFNYLGIPLGADPRRLSTWDPLVARFRSKLSGWKCRLLSFAGRVILVYSVLLALPLCFMSIFHIPKSILFRLDKWVAVSERSRNCSMIRKGIVKNLLDVEVEKWMSRGAFRWKLGDGSSIFFWEDAWCGENPSSVIFPRLYRLASGFEVGRKYFFATMEMVGLFRGD